MKIDYVLVPKDIPLVQARVWSGLMGSDHRPFIATIGVDGSRLNREGLFSYVGLGIPLTMSSDQESAILNVAAICLRDSHVDEVTPTDTLYQASAAVPVPRIKLKLCQTELVALVDTGSTWCLVDHKFISSQMKNFTKNFRPLAHKPLTLGDGQPSIAMTPMGDLPITLNLNGVELVQTFKVLPCLPERVIIGSSFFQDQRHRGADLSYQAAALTVDDRKIPFNNVVKPLFALYTTNVGPLQTGTLRVRIRDPVLNPAHDNELRRSVLPRE